MVKNCQWTLNLSLGLVCIISEKSPACTHILQERCSLAAMIIIVCFLQLSAIEMSFADSMLDLFLMVLENFFYVSPWWKQWPGVVHSSIFCTKSLWWELNQRISMEAFVFTLYSNCDQKLDPYHCVLLFRWLLILFESMIWYPEQRMRRLCIIYWVIFCAKLLFRPVWLTAAVSDKVKSWATTGCQWIRESG